MKKGISLIVLVITIIVMIIIAGAIIISLNSTNILSKADEAVDKTDVGAINDKLALAYVDLKFAYPTVKTFSATGTYTVGELSDVTLQAYYEAQVPEIKANSEELSDVPEGYSFEIYSNGSAMVVEYAEKDANAIDYVDYKYSNPEN